LRWIRKRSLSYGTPIPPLLFALVLLIGMLLLVEIGRRFGVRRHLKESEGERAGLGTVEGAVFALFGLMIAFTFLGAASRFNEKRMLIAVEVNCVETAYLRLHLLPHQAQPALEELFRRYVDASEYGRGRNGDGQIQADPGRDLD
jgi:prepilin signal peptidase PulO-like enzyme (type II secretory pathway)